MSRYIVKDIPGADTRYRKYMVLASTALLQALQREHPKLIRHLQTLPSAQQRKD